VHEGSMRADWRPLYDKAARQLSSAMGKMAKEGAQGKSKDGLKYVLTAIFLLTYTDVSALKLSL